MDAFVRIIYSPQTDRVWFGPGPLLSKSGVTPVMESQGRILRVADVFWQDHHPAQNGQGVAVASSSRCTVSDRFGRSRQAFQLQNAIRIGVQKHNPIESWY